MRQGQPGKRKRRSESPAEPAAAGANLRVLTGWRPVVSLGVCLAASGLLLSASYAPLEWDWLGWCALVPALVAAAPCGGLRRLLAGYLLGFVYCVTNLFWLNEIGFAAGVLLAIYCACFPAAWYALTAALAGALRASPAGEPPSALCRVPTGWRQSALILGSSLFWVGLEWLRSWLFTGFPWNDLGISQWQRPALLSLTCFTGVAGISALLMVSNLALAQVALTWWHGVRHGSPRRSGRVPAVTLGLALVLAMVAAMMAPTVPAPEASLRVLAVQGNIPQCRVWTEEQFDEAVAVYTGLTAQAVPVARPDLVVWPESAVPAPLGYGPFRRRVDALMAEIQTPLLLGALDSRALPDARWTGAEWEPPLQDFNAAILLAPDGSTVETYDKIHRVPFGEYVPFGRYLPWLVDWIGMGRDLTPGSEYTLFDLGPGLLAGANICFEDVFPEISRNFVRRGATLLLTLTNDAWYAESAGSRQHLVHAVFRAAENRRPLFRSGNNSDTCLILPDGRIEGLLYDPETGRRFIRGTRVYDVPISLAPPETLFTRWGNWFARACAAGAILLGLWLFRRHWRACARRREAILKPHLS